MFWVGSEADLPEEQEGFLAKHHGFVFSKEGMEGLAIEKPVNSTNGLHPKTTRNTPLGELAGSGAHGRERDAQHRDCRAAR